MEPVTVGALCCKGKGDDTKLPSASSLVMLRADTPPPEDHRVSDDGPEIDPGQEDGAPEASEQQMSKLLLWVAILIMLLPAGIPVYFALGLEGTDAIWLFALAAGIAVINVLLVYGLWTWIKSLSQSSET